MMSEQNQQSLRRKTRSASICAPGSSSMEQMLNAAVAAGIPPPGKENRILAGARKDSGGSATPESSSTPTRRRRPATRSQSARVTGANKSIRKRAAQQGSSYCEIGLISWNFFFFFSVNLEIFMCQSYEIVLQTTFYTWVIEFFSNISCLNIMAYSITKFMIKLATLYISGRDDEIFRKFR